MKTILFFATLGVLVPGLSYAVIHPFQSENKFWTHEVARLIKKEQSADHHLHYYNFWTSTANHSTTEPVFLDRLENYQAHYLGSDNIKKMTEPAGISMQPLQLANQNSYQLSVAKSGYFSLPLQLGTQEQCLVIFSVGINP